LGSADWMPRNLDRRVEAVTPIEEPILRQQLQNLLNAYLADNCSAWDMAPDGQFSQRQSESEMHGIQDELMQGWRTLAVPES